jgi:hypothetical protein
MYIALWIRAKVFCCDRKKKIHCYRQNEITNIIVVTKKIETTSL